MFFMEENLIVDNFLQNAVLVSQACINNLPERAYDRLAEALENGSEIEVRARLCIGAPVVSIWLLDPTGQSDLIASSDQLQQ